MQVVRALINSNIYISLASVSLTVSTQIQLGLKPQWHPYLFLIFFATLFEYNFHRLITVITNKEALNSEKHAWVKENMIGFYLLVFVSVLGFTIAFLLAKTEVLLTLAPFAALTLFYSAPVPGRSKGFFRLRQIPFLKIFLISIVWSAATILLPVIYEEQNFDKAHVLIMMAERFLFIFAITIPFDIRDLDADRKAGLRTIPLFLGKEKSLLLSSILLILFILISVIHYFITNQIFISISLVLSGLTSLVFLNSKKIQNLTFYHYGILDGTILLQGLLVLLFFFCG